MLLWTINELMHLTQDELCDLCGNRTDLSGFKTGTARRLAALTSLDNIRRVMLGRRFVLLTGRRGGPIVPRKQDSADRRVVRIGINGVIH